MMKSCLLWLNLFADLLAFDRMLPRKAPSWSNQRRQLFSSKPKPLFATSKSPRSSVSISARTESSRKT
jgi:hypothetical protein